MSSKLFHAIVGVGISLGATTVGACGGAEESAHTNDASANDTPNEQPGANHAPTETPDASGDAAVDAPEDAILDAFCDAAWPTTKGNHGGPTCGAVEACADAGFAPKCIKQTGPATCDSNGGTFPAWCIDGAWQCSTGAISQDQCRCWAGQPCP